MLTWCFFVLVVLTRIGPKIAELLFHGRVFHCRSSWPPTDLSERIVQLGEKSSASTFVTSESVNVEIGPG